MSRESILVKQSVVKVSNISKDFVLPNFGVVKGASDLFKPGSVIYTGLNGGFKAGLPIGEVFVNDNSEVTLVSSSGFTQFNHFDTNGHSNLSTPDHTENHIVIDVAGVYMVDCCVNIKNSSGNAHDIEVVVAKNDGTTIFPNMRRHRTLGTGTDVGAIPLCGHLGLLVGDTLEVWITSDSASARNVTGEDVVLMITLVSPT